MIKRIGIEALQSPSDQLTPTVESKVNCFLDITLGVSSVFECCSQSAGTV